MDQDLKIIIHRLSGLFRTRVILSVIGLGVLCHIPQAGQWIVAIVGLALGVSGVDAWHEGKNNGIKNTARNIGDTPKDGD